MSYSLSDDAGGRFAIDKATGVITVAAGASLDYESTHSYAVTVVASDGTLSSSTSLTVSLTNVNEAPGAAGFMSGGTVAESAAAGTVVGTVRSEEHTSELQSQR